MKNSKFDTFNVKTKCENKLGIKFKGKKEFNGWFKFNNMKIARITVPKGRKSIPPKTYESMATQLKLDVDDFNSLLECPLKKPGYIKILRDTGYIAN